MSFEHMPFPAAERPTPNEVPDGEIKRGFVRSSGPGGQNVNKVSTKADIRWNVRESSAFTDEEKTLIEAELENIINKKGEAVIQCSTSRSQKRNEAKAIAKLQERVQKALTPEAERVPTKPSRAAKRKRVEEKREHSRKKRERGRKDWD